MTIKSRVDISEDWEGPEGRVTFVGSFGDEHGYIESGVIALTCGGIGLLSWLICCSSLVWPTRQAGNEFLRDLPFAELSRQNYKGSRCKARRVSQQAIVEFRGVGLFKGLGLRRVSILYSRCPRQIPLDSPRCLSKVGGDLGR